jgi:hypothetical protein
MPFLGLSVSNFRYCTFAVFTETRRLVPPIIIQGVWRLLDEMFITIAPMHEVDLAAAQHLLKPLLWGEISLRLWALRKKKFPLRGGGEGWTEETGFLHVTSKV